MQTSELDCPLCMEPLEIDDVNFYPCTCGYQVCRFCWHRIRTDENGLCPACRKAYSEDPAVYTPLSQDQIQRIIRERKQKDTQRKQKLTENRKHLANVRVVQKNLVFVVGLTQRLADPELLKRTEYFGKFGKIHKIVINNSTNYAGPQGPSASAYITFNKEEDAHKAILAVSNAYLDGRTLKASLGTTKYCSYFLRNISCPKPDCMYLHDLGDEAASFTKEEMQDGKHQEYEQLLLSNYARKMGVNTDKDSKELWSGAAGSSLPSGSGWGVKEEEDSTYSNTPQADRECSPSFELYNQNDDGNYWEDEDDWEVNTDKEEQTQEHTPQTIPTTIPHTIAHTAHTQPYQNTNTATQGWPLETTTQTISKNPLLEYQPTTGFFDSGPADTVCSLGLTNLHLKVSADDDLGFDPWNESSKGLADLLQEEVRTTCHNQAPLYATTIPTRTQFGSYSHQQTKPEDDFKSWQESFRALLPNININFSGWSTSTEGHRNPSEWSPATQATPVIPNTTPKQVVRPPPGFEAKKPEPHVPMVDDPSIVWSKAVGAKTDPIPIVPGIVTNGFSGLSSGNGPSDLPGAVSSPRGF